MLIFTHYMSKQEFREILQYTFNICWNINKLNWSWTMLTSKRSLGTPRQLRKIVCVSRKIITSSQLDDIWQMADGGWWMTDDWWRTKDEGRGTTDKRWRMTDDRWRWMAGGGWRIADYGWRMTDDGWQMTDDEWRMTDDGSRSSPIWAECRRPKARHWEHPKMYLPEHYPGSTIQSRSAARKAT